MAAAKGNNNAGKARIVRDQMKWALENYTSGSVAHGQALRQICTNLIAKAVEEGDMVATQTIFDRIEGRPVQAIAGDDESPLEFIHRVELIALTHGHGSNSDT